jgi:hypothetical protein
MSRPKPKRPVEDTLTTVSSLRRLCLALPHATTPAEVRQLDRFERLREGAVPLNEEDLEALRTGLRQCWRSRDTQTLRQMAARIPATFLDRDRWLQSFVVAAQALTR